MLTNLYCFVCLFVFKGVAVIPKTALWRDLVFHPSGNRKTNSNVQIRWETDRWKALTFSKTSPLLVHWRRSTGGRDLSIANAEIVAAPGRTHLSLRMHILSVDYRLILSAETGFSLTHPQCGQRWTPCPWSLRLLVVLLPGARVACPRVFLPRVPEEGAHLTSVRGHTHLLCLQGPQQQGCFKRVPSAGVVVLVW